MARFRQFIGTVALVLGVVAAVLGDLPGTSPSAAPEVPLGAYRAPDRSQVELVTEAHALFADLGLHFENDPIVSFHDSQAECGDNLALWRREADADRIRVCWTHPDPSIQRTLQRQVLVHELAHAWVFHNVDEATKVAFTQLVKAQSWNSPEHLWEDRATEIAAELVTWALVDPLVLLVDLDGQPCTTWIEAFELLIGTDAPAPIADGCAAGPAR